MELENKQIKMDIANLLEDLVEEIFCKLPVTSLGAVRLTCKKWNSILKNRRFAEKHISKAAAATRELSVIMVINHKVFLMGLHILNGIPSINRKAELVNLENEDKVGMSGVFHCDGLLLCSNTVTRGIVVWNPYWGHTRLIAHRHFYCIPNFYVMGYEVMNNSRSHKILTFFEYVNRYENIRSDGYEIYDFKNNSWSDLVITEQDRNMNLSHRSNIGVSLKGNTYWCSTEHIGEEVSLDFLICFDFTREKFGPRMSLPCAEADNIVLSSVREEKLAVLFERRDTLEMEIWITSEIEPTMVSWSKVFLIVKKTPFDDCPLKSSVIGGSFFVDEENKVAVFIGKCKDKPHNMAYISGVGGYLREVDLGEFTKWFPWPRVCSYAPSSVHIE